jgi:hypothetical protein
MARSAASKCFDTYSKRNRSLIVVDEAHCTHEKWTMARMHKQKRMLRNRQRGNYQAKYSFAALFAAVGERIFLLAGRRPTT